MNNLPDSPSLHHAILTADVRVSPSPSTQLVLHCGGRRRLLVHARPEVIPAYFWCGVYRATVRLRTDSAGRLKPTLRLLALTEQPAELPAPLSWTVTGLVAADPNVLVVKPRSTRIRPSRIHYRPDPKADFAPRATGESVQVRGIVRAGILVATSMADVEPLARSRSTQSLTRWV